MLVEARNLAGVMRYDNAPQPGCRAADTVSPLHPGASKRI